MRSLSFEKALRKLAPEPGMWVSRNDLCNLADAFGFHDQFPDPRWTSWAAKLRVVDSVAPDCQSKRKELSIKEKRVELSGAGYGQAISSSSVQDSNVFAALMRAFDALASAT